MTKPAPSYRLLLWLTMLVLTSSCSKKGGDLRLAGPVARIDQEIATDLAALFNQESELKISLTDAELSGEQALDAILNGTADIALVSNALPYREGIATIIPLFPTVLHIGYFGDREFDDGVSLLRGARVFAGAEGSASRLMFEQSVRRLQLTQEDFTFVDEPTEELDVVVVFAPISPDLLSSLHDFRLYSADTPDGVGRGTSIDAATLLNPHLRPFVIPVGTYGDATPESILTVAVDKMLVTRRDVDPTVVYDFISDLLRLRPALAAKRPGLFSDLSGDFDPSRSTFVIHEGAQAYLERSEPSVYERYSGIAEVAVTVLIALISAVFGAMRLYRMKRKNRIDTYYSEAISIRNLIKDSMGADERKALTKEMKSLQDKAFEELVDEKLAADESFRIFITLSNDVLRQLQLASADFSISDE